VLWGKLIDHDRCIGCHACSVACKSENQVPLGVFRTWVKQVEKGAGLSARRHFGVLRCNQCENAPCVAICPTAAMHRRPDGIVDFDGDLCVGCKACIQACPYDAIYIDPVSNTAAKCNFCAQRIEVGLQPACVAACPTDALVVSDLADPASPVARAVDRGGVQVRKPELGTRPKVFYKGADAVVLDPRAAVRPAQGIWGSSRPVEPEVQPIPLPVAGPRPAAGAPAAARVAYDVPREGAPWGAKIVAYLVFKAIAAGALMVGGLDLLLAADAPVLGVWPPLYALIGIGLTLACLVADLKRPERFLYLLTKPQSGSWLVKGAYVLTAGAILAAAYTALLFGQAKGRALWQSPLLLPHLVVQAVVAGSAALILFPLFASEGSVPPDLWSRRLVALGVVLGAGLALNFVMILGELWAHGNEDVRLAVRWMMAGERGTTLTVGVIGVGHLFPLFALAAAFVLPGAAPAVALAAVGALAGVYLWDHLYVGAGQAPPLS
jgi:Fe-S-cluster-containing dehydrogenase component/formate-dependent nitrite reductase membrane component NrfD